MSFLEELSHGSLIEANLQRLCTSPRTDMDVRLARIAIVAHMSNDLAAANFVSGLDSELCHVTQEKEHAVISFQNDE